MARTGTPPREKARVYRTGRPDRLRPLLFAVAALILCAGIGAVLTKHCAERAIWVSCVLLTISFLIMFIREDN